MRLFYVHSSSLRTPGANSLQVARMCQAFSHAGAEVTLLQPRLLTGNPLAEGEWRDFYGVDDSFESRRLWTLLTPRLTASRAYLPLAKAAAYLLEAARQWVTGGWRPGTVLYTRCFAAAYLFPKLRRWLPRARRPQVVFESHEYPPDRLRAPRLLEVDGVVAITRALGDELVERLGLDPARLQVAADGVPREWLDPGPSRAEARRLLGLPLDRRLAVYTGRLHRGTLGLLREAAVALAGEADVLAVGPAADGWEAAGDGAAASNLRLQPPVPAPRVRLYQAAADVLLAPYTRELRWRGYTSPLKVFEYMASGRPIVASHLPVLEEVLEHRRTAWFVPLDDGPGLAEGVVRLLHDEALAEGLAARARGAVAEHTWEARASRILRFLADLPEAA